MGLVSLPNTFVDDVDQVASGDEVMENFNAILAAVNGNLDATNFAASIGTPVLFSGGKSIVTASEARSSTSYGLLATPDRVSGLVVPENGLILLGFYGLMAESVSAAARASIFIGSTQLKGANGVTLAARTGGSGAPGLFAEVVSCPLGLASHDPGVLSGVAAPVTTGQVIGRVGTSAVDSGGASVTLTEGAGGLCVVFAAAGTYDVSVQYKASSGSVTAKERRLWAWTIGF